MSGSADPTDALVGALRAVGCVFAEDEARLLIEAAPPGPERDRLVARRLAGIPLEHVLGWVEFAGLRIEVDDGVFVPRQRSVLLARLAGDALAAAAGRAVDGPSPASDGPAVVVDLCCGSGALGVAVVSSCETPVELHAADLDPAAVACARRNLAPLGGVAYVGDLDEPIPARLAGRVTVLVVNAPYVPSHAVGLMPREAREHEAVMALDGGDDGLDLLRRVLRVAPRWLSPGGTVIVELGEGQVDALLDEARAVGLDAQVVRDDDLGATALVATA